jgi:uncharacterized membrane protein
MTDLGTFSATAMSEATAVNRGGDVVGGSGGHALFVHNGTMTDLGLGGNRHRRRRPDRGQLPGCLRDQRRNPRQRTAINDNGQEHAFLLTPS